MNEFRKSLEKNARETMKKGLEELRADTFKHISEKYKHLEELPCVVCGNNTWRMHIHRGQFVCGTADTVRPMVTPMSLLTGGGYPLLDGLDILTMECDTCRQLLFFNVYEEKDENNDGHNTD